MESLALKLATGPHNKIKTSIVFPSLVDSHPKFTKRFNKYWWVMKPGYLSLTYATDANAVKGVNYDGLQY